MYNMNYPKIAYYVNKGVRKVTLQHVDLFENICLKDGLS